ncbi:uncharacterized protein [Montipora foliosa]|uniref:uncharacterized protein n=1 Tax=Montipora foliosa TaxID=591990 RepID=UPI0035F1BAFA
MTDEGAISIDTLIKDVIVTLLDCNRWADSLNSPHITSLQLADDFSQPQFPVQILIGLDAVWQFLNLMLLKLDLWKPYASVIADQIDKGYVETVPANEDPLRKNDAHYLSHFFVLRPESETTPIRVVFAANAGHISLNNCLYTGPCLLRSLNTIIRRFRANKYAFVADIKKAFMRIKVNEEDRNYFRFLWFEDGDHDKSIRVYRYASVFFGGQSSPFILNFTILHHLSKHKKDQDPAVQFVAQDLEKKLYCDNVFTGADDEDTAIQYYNISRKVMKDADMTLRQWFTNWPALTNIIDKMRTGSERDHAGFAKQLAVFIRNRTTEILRLTDLSSWSHVSSANNRADILSRGCSADGGRWWPRWSPTTLAEDDVVSTTAVDSHVQGTQSHSGSLPDLIDISRFQSYERVLGTIADVLRFISNLKHASVHERQLHAGVRETVVALRKRFWLPSARSEITRVLERCVKCRYQIGGAYKLPPSAPLPDFRLNMVTPFSTVGIDFTSHLM